MPGTWESSLVAVFTASELAAKAAKKTTARAFME